MSILYSTFSSSRSSSTSTQKLVEIQNPKYCSYLFLEQIIVFTYFLNKSKFESPTSCDVIEQDSNPLLYTVRLLHSFPHSNEHKSLHEVDKGRSQPILINRFDGAKGGASFLTCLVFKTL